MASYTKNTLLAIKRTSPQTKITVLANIVDATESYAENGISVIRCWKRNSPFLYLTLLNQILSLKNTKNILIGFEFAAYGELLTTSFLPIFLYLLKLAGKNIVSVVHQVVPNISNLATHAGINKSKKDIKILNFGIKIYFKILSLASNKVITLENELAKRFNKLTNTKKAVSIPHGLYLQKSENKRLAQKKLNLSSKYIYLLSFGYLSQYKGTDLLVKAFHKPLKINGKTVKLILAGGESPTQGQKYHYQHFYKNLYKSISDNENIIHTGFVPQEKIKHIFSSSDLVIFPYRAFMSASGPISLALGFNKPIIVSNQLENYSTNSFFLNTNSLRKKIIETLSSNKTLKKLKKESMTMAQNRNFNRQGQIYIDQFNIPLKRVSNIPVTA